MVHSVAHEAAHQSQGDAEAGLLSRLGSAPDRLSADPRSQLYSGQVNQKCLKAKASLLHAISASFPAHCVLGAHKHNPPRVRLLLLPITKAFWIKGKG